MTDRQFWSGRLTDEPNRRRSVLWLAIGAIAAAGILGNVAIAIWLLNRTV